MFYQILSCKYTEGENIHLKKDKQNEQVCCKGQEIIYTLKKIQTSWLLTFAQSRRHLKNLFSFKTGE